MKHKAKPQRARDDVASSEKGKGGDCPICGASPCTCNDFPDVLRVELLDYAPPEPDSGGSP
jgi:hypothetical protein